MKLNKGKREIVFMVVVEDECFVQALFAYAKQNNIDPTNTVKWEQAIRAVSRFDFWKDHPHATIVLGEDPHQEPTETRQEPAKKEPQRSWSLTEEESTSLKSRARELPHAEWEEALLTPIPDELLSSEKKWFYNRRHQERAILDQLKEETGPSPLERMGVVKELLGANGIH